MAAASEVRWPNEKEQYELQEVIGEIIVVFVSNLTSQVSPDVIFLFRVWCDGRCSSCEVHPSQ